MNKLVGPPLVDHAPLLQSFFYDLLRDCAPAGTVERAVDELETICYGRLSPENVVYSNEHLARYAGELADRVMKAVGHQLKKADMVADPTECECADWTMVGYSKDAYWPLDDKGAPTGHHPGCKHYIPPS